MGRSSGYTRLRSTATTLAVIATGLVIATARVPDAGATIVERVVAVVGERPILLSELRLRGRPHLWRIRASSPGGAQQAALESDMYRELLNRLIDERLEESAAGKARIAVSPEEIDNGIRQVAAQAKLQPSDLLAEAKRQGLSESDYRDEVRRQVLEGKLIQLRIRGRVRVTDDDARAAYTKWSQELAQQHPIDVRILVLQVPPGDSAAKSSRTELATTIVQRARGGEDFCTLVANYTEDPATQKTCGSRGPVPLQALFPELQQAVGSLRPGETTDPIEFRDPSGGSALLIVQLASKQPEAQPFEKVKDKMLERAYVEATERQRKQWLQELRQGVYIDVRL